MAHHNQKSEMNAGDWNQTWISQSLAIGLPLTIGPFLTTIVFVFDLAVYKSNELVRCRQLGMKSWHDSIALTSFGLSA